MTFDCAAKISAEAPKAILALLVAATLSSGCSHAPPSKFREVPGGAVAYPGVSRYLGPIAYHRLYSILPGDAQFECGAKARVVLPAPRRIEIVSCRAGSEQEMGVVAEKLAISFSYLEESSHGAMRFCDVYLGLADFDAGVHASDTQSLKRPCARLMMLARWQPGLDSERASTALRSIIMNTAHEAYHLSLRRIGPRERSREIEEAEADIVGRCAVHRSLGSSLAQVGPEEVIRPDEKYVNEFYHDTIAGGRVAIDVIRNGRVQELAERAPAGLPRTVLTACARELTSART